MGAVCGDHVRCLKELWCAGEAVSNVFKMIDLYPDLNLMCNNLAPRHQQARCEEWARWG